MILAIQMPEWLTNFWIVYGDMITPILTTLLTTIVTWLCLKIRTDAKLNATKADLQIKALKDVANREDNKPQLEEQSKKIEELEKIVAYLSDMFNLAFQNSDLDPEIKSNLASLVNKIKYGTEEDLVKQLETTNAQLQSQLETLQLELKEQTTQQFTPEQETKQTRTRR